MFSPMLRGLSIVQVCVLCISGAAATSCGPKTHKKIASETMPENITIDHITKGRELAGFTAEAVYLDGSDQRIGARFLHDATGFTLDLVFIETAPQAFLWVNTFPTSDMGEPHTQEHLLLGKGNKGRYVASVESMSLTDSSAFTSQWRTCYHMHTVAGLAVFWDVLEHKLDGLLHPDYSDEEIRREVRNFGVSADPKSGELRLEEKGTVYNEMVRSFESPTRLMWRRLQHFQYGQTHPLAVSSGGFPAAIRKMTARDITKFHADTYHLGNMGLVAALPRSVKLATILTELSGALERQAIGQPKGTTKALADLPAPQSAKPGSTAVVGYPHSNPQKPGSVTLAWPPSLKLDVAETILLQLFLGNFAGDSSTNLYKALVDSETRTLELGTTGVWTWVSSDPGNPIFIGASNVEAKALTEDGIELLRGEVENQLRAVAAWPDDSPELATFNERILSRIVQTQRGLAKFMNSPPRFGFRGTGSSWLDHLDELDAEGAFERSLTMKPQLAWVQAQLARKTNIWRDYLPAWRLTTTQPYGAAAKADPALLAQLAKEHQARLDAELARLQQAYGTATPAETLSRYQAEYDANTAKLEAASKGMKMPGFTREPPQTLDDALVYEDSARQGVRYVKSTFESMTGATVGAAFDLHGVATDKLIYLSIIASLLREVGMYENGVALSHEQLTDQLRNQVLSISAYVTTNFHTGRAELVLRGAGNDAAETVRALAWMKRFITGSDWRPENLARIRDVIDQRAKSLRNRMSGAEEGWVNDPVNIYEKQTDALLAHTSSFLTRSHNLHRLRWLLRADRPELGRFLDALRVIGSTGRDALATLTARPDQSQNWPEIADQARTRYDGLPSDDKKLAGEILTDLGQLLAEIPDSSLSTDWSYLCRQIKHDLAVAPTDVLAELSAIRAVILRRGGMRLFAIGSSAAHDATLEGIDALIASVPDGAAPRASHRGSAFILERLRQRLGSGSAPMAAPIFLGLVNPNTQSGVFINSAPGYGYDTSQREDLLRYLAGNVYTGHGAHSIFMKTWSAGLAYSNGLRGSLAQERIRYYAERCPELAQTLAFVISELALAKPRPELVDYAIAQSFGSRAAASFEGRGEAMAANLADGLTPDDVRSFRHRLLELRATPDLATELFERMQSEYGKVLPGFGPASRDVEGGLYYVIGPDKLLDQWQAYLRRTEGEDAKLYRLYPRDYWITAAEVSK